MLLSCTTSYHQPPPWYTNGITVSSVYCSTVYWFTALRFIGDNVVDVFAQLRDEALLHMTVDLGLALGHFLNILEACHFALHHLYTGKEEEEGREGREGKE